jgi:N-glycosylase/DNA lyase
MNVLKVKNYNLNATLESGQILTVQSFQGRYYVSTSQLIIELYQDKDNIYWQTYPTSNQESFVREFLRLDDEYESILNIIKKDPYITTAIDKYKDLRLLKQLFPDTVISFIISANKNIPAIKTSIKKLNERLGREIYINNKSFYLLPSTDILAKTEVAILKETGIGYRADYLKNASEIISDINFQSSMSTVDIKKNLLTLPGVGNKVADCILLYGLKRDEVTPLDRWAYKFLQEYYHLNPELKYEELSKWIENYFEGYAGWAGQYLFEYIKSQ